MIWLVWIVLLILSIALLAVSRRLRQAEVLIMAHSLQLRTRQGRSESQVVSNRNPRVDSRARTTKRDSFDLPLTGRMSQAIVRKRSDARPSNDS